MSTEAGEEEEGFEKNKREGTRGLNQKEGRLLKTGDAAIS